MKTTHLPHLIGQTVVSDVVVNVGDKDLAVVGCLDSNFGHIRCIGTANRHLGSWIWLLGLGADGGRLTHRTRPQTLTSEGQ